MKPTVQLAKSSALIVILGGCLFFVGLAPTLAHAADVDYGSRAFGGSSYVQHGPGPAYGSAYSDYGGNATGIEGRFSASYGEYSAVPGYGRFGPGSSYGTGPLRSAGTGRGSPDFGRKTGQRPSQAHSGAPSPGHRQPEPKLPF